MHQHGHNDPNAGKLYELIKDVKIAMMTTVDTDGTLHSRPMHNQEADEHGDLWFFTQIQSPKTTELSRDSEVNLAYSDPSSQTYVSVMVEGGKPGNGSLYLKGFGTGEVTVPPEQLRVLDKYHSYDFELRAGMPVQILIPLRARTALDYVLEPLTGAFWSSFREH